MILSQSHQLPSLRLFNPWAALTATATRRTTTSGSIFRRASAGTKRVKQDLSNVDACFPAGFTEEQKARCKTTFYKMISEAAHAYYGGKMQVFPKVPIAGHNWFNVWYTPGVSQVSRRIQADNSASLRLTNRGNTVAIVSDSTRVLGDGDVTPPGGLGVMEGKAMLMKWLGGIDAVPLCIDSRGPDGVTHPEHIIDFVRRAQHSFGAVNLEDISQPNCYKVLDDLRDACTIPVWHDDQQGTACVTLAGLINALKLTGKKHKKLFRARIVFFGAGAANTTCLRLILSAGADPDNVVMFDSKGGLHSGRADLRADPRFYRKWEICCRTNPRRVDKIEDAVAGADVLIALSRPGPHVVKPEWIRRMAEKPIVFACANPVPEIYPYMAKRAGAFIVATGRGDFPNQLNNSIGFPGILKGALLARASKITDNMAVAASHSLARFAERRGIDPENIIPTMDETEVFPTEAADVAMAAVRDGVAREKVTWEGVYKRARADIMETRAVMSSLVEKGHMKEFPQKSIQKIFDEAVARTLMK